jgi:hypothetical protein
MTATHGDAAALAGWAMNPNAPVDQRLAAGKQALDFYVDQADKLDELAQKWDDFEGVSSNPGDVEDDAFANGTEWGMKMAARQLRAILGAD